MLIFKHTKDLVLYLKKINHSKRSVGFVPTMGALHDGHLSLINAAKQDNSLVICSIFVNPTQFNNQDDLDKYPITMDKDIEALSKVGCDILFSPTPEEIYPNGSNYKLDVNLAGLDKVMEGAFRPGHFEGVVQVVKALLDIVLPNKLYMGQKDFQQFTIIQQMLSDLKVPTSLVVVPIKREENGLAMSSRNTRLSAENRALASCIYQALLTAKEQIETGVDIAQVKAMGMKFLQDKGLEPEYFDIASCTTLLPITTYDATEKVVICVAAWLQGVRLIDNEIV